MVKIKIKQKLFEFDNRIIAYDELLKHGKKYNYNMKCRCSGLQSRSSFINWYTKHGANFDKDYICKDCCRTEQFTIFNKTWNTYADCMDYAYKHNKFKCSICNKKLGIGTYRYWIKKLLKNPNETILCKPCSDNIKCHNINGNQIDKLYVNFSKVKTLLLSEYKKFYGDYKHRNKNNNFAKKIIKQFKSKGLYCERYIDYAINECKISNKGNHHLLPNAIFPNCKYFIKCDKYTHSILHYLLLLDNFEHYTRSKEQKQVIQGLNVRYVFHKNNLSEIFTESLIKRLKKIYS